LGVGRDRHLHLTLCEEPAATAEVRLAVDEIAARYALSDEERFDLRLAVTEAVTNALKGTPRPHPVDVTLAGNEEVLEIEVADRGVFSPVRAALHRGQEAESGRGVALMLALMDDVEFKRTDAGTRVRLRKRLGRASELRLAG
jgi:serine/threonine-protein kinase RsbW